MFINTSATTLIEQIATQLKAKPFVPSHILKQGDLQTLGAYFWPGRFRARDLTGDEERLFAVEPDSQVLARCRWQRNAVEQPTLLLWHGLGGSTTSAYMLTTADKAFGMGFNVLRVNIRNCADTEHLTPTLSHAGLTADLRAVIDELITRDHLRHLFVTGFSLGGNLVLKLIGEYGAQAPRELVGACAVSPSIDLRASTDLLTERRNWIYHQTFLRRLKRRVRRKAELFPAIYDVTGLDRIRSIEQFDNRYIAPAFGFADASDYYARASSLPFIRQIRTPTLIIHAQDDPFIPFASLRNSSIAANPYVLLLAPERGGHVAFISGKSPDEDRFWAENRLLDFGRALFA
ncbi:MAG TPA: alpha/beta fold hydrolase [Pyrinomonadaceae bacterium]|nr:alpha/beta fold hydrolase [Pyrinomonadaceae bacterium]